MSTDRQLRQRVEELRRQLELTISETRAAIRSTRQITAESQRRRDSRYDELAADSAEHIRTSREILGRGF